MLRKRLACGLLPAAILLGGLASCKDEDETAAKTDTAAGGKEKAAGDEGAKGKPGEPLPAEADAATISLSGAPTGGTFVLQSAGRSSAPIAFDATASEFAQAVAALVRVEVAGLRATGGPLPRRPITIVLPRGFRKKEIRPDPKRLKGKGTPQAVIERSPARGRAVRHYSGTGETELGTITIGKPGGVIQLSAFGEVPKSAGSSKGFIDVSGQVGGSSTQMACCGEPRSTSDVEAGTFRNVIVDTPAGWTMVIRQR